jgi:ABC-2 type transport system ATP-binding protein
VAAAVRDEAAVRRIPAVLRRVGLAERADQKVGGYSQGMRQRLGVARCLLADPELLILDEPMNGLDPGGIIEFREMINELVDEGRTVFLSSHLLDEVQKTCEAAAVIDQGRLVVQGKISEILGQGCELEIGCEEPRLALDLLDGLPQVAGAQELPDGLRVSLAGADGAAAINSRLVGAGIAVFRLQPVQETLEQRFLAITSRFGGDR